MSRITAIEQNRERLASLGTMAAGLAHELNNPAAAARRAAADMAEALDVRRARRSGASSRRGSSARRPSELVALQREALDARRRRARPLDALDAADAEDALLERARGPRRRRAVAPRRAAGRRRRRRRRGSSASQRARRAGDRRRAALGRGHADRARPRRRARRSRPSGCRRSSARSSRYAYMDRGELVEVDLHEGLETTLIVLGHKLKHTTIEVVRDYDRDAARSSRVRGSELNQVWTNLLDNAIDALGEHGHDHDHHAARRRLRARRRSPTTARASRAEIRDRVFDSFFTTKDVGAGHRARPRHRAAHRRRPPRRLARRRLASPGETIFHVWLPLDGGLSLSRSRRAGRRDRARRRPRGCAWPRRPGRGRRRPWRSCGSGRRGRRAGPRRRPRRPRARA